jgi:serine/threonine-protein kinase RsbW
MTAPATMDLELASAAESVALVRAGLKGFGTLLRLDPELLDDLQMVASEACNNVVRHAYRAGSGPLRFRACATTDGVALNVRDHGEWTEARSTDDEQTGLGLAVIEALADRAALEQLPEGGTEVRMSFARPVPALERTDLDPGPGGPASDDVSAATQSVALSGDVVATVSPVALLPGILGRLARAVAAQARFSVERFPDIRVVVDSLVGHAQRWAANGRICVALGSDVRRLDFRLGPVRRSASGLEGISCSEGLRPRLSALIDELRFEPRAEAEVLSLSFTERGLAQAI